MPRNPSAYCVRIRCVPQCTNSAERGSSDRPLASGRDSGERILVRGPVPRQQFVEPAGGMFGDAGQHIGEPCLGIDVVEFCRDDETVKESGTLAAAVGAGEQPCLASKGQAAQRSLGGIVNNTNRQNS